MSAAITFKCPNTGFTTHSWVEKDDSPADYIFQTIPCTACRGVHLVNLKTGRVIGDRQEKTRP